MSIDAAAAQALPGVLAVVTAENAGKLGKGSTNAAPLLGGPEIEHYHQAIGSSSPNRSNRRARPRRSSRSCTIAPRAPSISLPRRMRR